MPALRKGRSGGWARAGAPTSSSSAATPGRRPRASRARPGCWRRGSAGGGCGRGGDGRANERTAERSAASAVGRHRPEESVAAQRDHWAETSSRRTGLGRSPCGDVVMRSGRRNGFGSRRDRIPDELEVRGLTRVVARVRDPQDLRQVDSGIAAQVRVVRKSFELPARLDEADPSGGPTRSVLRRRS